MNIEDALLTRRLLGSLIGSTGKTHDQLAKEHQTVRRRMTNLIFCLEKVGLVSTHETGVVTLSHELASLVINHAKQLLLEDELTGPAFEGWTRLLKGEQLRFLERNKTDFPGLFNELFGSKK